MSRIVHPSRYTDPRDMQLDTFGDHSRAIDCCAELVKAGIKCAVHKFPETPNHWHVCADRKSQLVLGIKLAKLYRVGVEHGWNQANGLR